MTSCDHIDDPFPCDRPRPRLRRRTASADGFPEARQLANEAADAVTGDRNVDYGHPSKDFAAQALALRVYTKARFGMDLQWEPRDPRVIALG